MVVVGDGAVGKTCLVTSYGKNGFISEYVPTVATNFESKIEYEGRTIALDIWDTGGQDEFREVRKTTYAKADVFIFCFAVDQETSLTNACSKWMKEIESAGSTNAAKILCCTK